MVTNQRKNSFLLPLINQSVKSSTFVFLIKVPKTRRPAYSNISIVKIHSGVTASCGLLERWLSLCMNIWVCRGRFAVTYIKPLFCINYIFPYKKQIFIKTRNSFFSIVNKTSKDSATLSFKVSSSNNFRTFGWSVLKLMSWKYVMKVF